MTKQQKTDSGASQNGDKTDVASFEAELAGYLQERIKPGLNSGAIPLLARSIAKDIAHREPFNGVSDEGEEPSDDEPTAEGDDEPTAEGDDEPSAESDDEPTAESDEEPTAAGDEDDDEDDDALSADAEDDDEDDDALTADAEPQSDFEADMHEFQAELGDDWILRFSVQGDDAWLTAEKDDGSQRVEAETAEVLSAAVALLNERGGRSS